MHGSGMVGAANTVANIGIRGRRYVSWWVGTRNVGSWRLSRIRRLFERETLRDWVMGRRGIRRRREARVVSGIKVRGGSRQGVRARRRNPVRERVIVAWERNVGGDGFERVAQ